MKRKRPTCQKTTAPTNKSKENNMKKKKKNGVIYQPTNRNNLGNDERFQLRSAPDSKTAPRRGTTTASAQSSIRKPPEDRWSGHVGTRKRSKVSRYELFLPVNKHTIKKYPAIKALIIDRYPGGGTLPDFPTSDDSLSGKCGYWRNPETGTIVEDRVLPVIIDQPFGKTEKADLHFEEMAAEIRKITGEDEIYWVIHRIERFS